MHEPTRGGFPFRRWSGLGLLGVIVGLVTVGACSDNQACVSAKTGLGGAAGLGGAGGIGPGAGGVSAGGGGGHGVGGTVGAGGQGGGAKGGSGGGAIGGAGGTLAVGGGGAGNGGSSGVGGAGGATTHTAIVVPGIGSAFNYHQGSYSLGWTFVANASIHVTTLGFYDDAQNGLTETHPVGIFDEATMALLGSVTVSNADPLMGFFHYAPLTTPVALAAGHAYVAMAVVGSEDYLAFETFDPSWTADPAITYGGSAVYYGSTTATTLIFPDTIATTAGDFGPNFQFTNP